MLFVGLRCCLEGAAAASVQLCYFPKEIKIFHPCYLQKRSNQNFCFQGKQATLEKESLTEETGVNLECSKQGGTVK